MKHLIFLFFICFTAAWPQQSKDHSTSLQCKTCHACEYPTTKDPCLVDCPREDMITIRHPASEAPRMMILKSLSERYAPVIFSHRLHAEMADMSGGCASCHHYNTTGPILSCQTCHEAKNASAELGKPGLKGAYHRQCMNCHSEWSGNSRCTTCHVNKSQESNTSLSAAKDKLSGKKHVTVDKPNKLVFKTNSDKGAFVTFYHSDHVQFFGASCANCHQNISCGDCHSQDKKQVLETSMTIMSKNKAATADEKHKACFTCHKDDACAKCHRDSEMKPFDHALSTGWSLGRFHERTACSSCHIGKITKLNRECSSCHKSWSPKNFNHSITGLSLSADHVSLECTDCHANKQFNKPVCTDCHDDKTYPKDLPGIRTKR